MSSKYRDIETDLEMPDIDQVLTRGFKVGFASMIPNGERSSRYPGKVRLSWVSVGFSSANCYERLRLHPQEPQEIPRKR